MTNSLESSSSSGEALRPIANICSTGACPTIYQASSGALVVQGFSVPVDQAGIDVPAGEALVEIPAALLAEALRNLG